MSRRDDPMGTRARWMEEAPLWQVAICSGIFMAVIPPLMQSAIFGENYLEAFLPGGLISGLLFGAVWAYLTHLHRSG